MLRRTGLVTDLVVQAHTTKFVTSFQLILLLAATATVRSSPPIRRAQLRHVLRQASPTVPVADVWHPHAAVVITSLSHGRGPVAVTGPRASRPGAPCLRRMHDRGGHPIGALADRVSVSRPTVCRTLTKNTAVSAYSSGTRRNTMANWSVMEL